MSRSLLSLLAVALAVLCCVSAAAARPQLNPDEALQLVEGFVTGLEVEVSGNLSVCIADEQADFVEFETAFAQLDDGFKHLNVSAVEAGITDFGKGVEMFAIVLKACGAENLVADIEEIAQELQSGGDGIIKVLLKEAVNIFHHSTDLTSEFKAAIYDWQNGLYFSAGENIGEIVGVLLMD